MSCANDRIIDALEDLLHTSLDLSEVASSPSHLLAGNTLDVEDI